MAVPNNSSLTAEHRRHDRLLVARFAAGDAAPGQEHEAQDLIRRCSDCAALAADISTISKSVAQLPAPARPRDFRLGTDDAARLRGSRFDRWLRTLTGSGWATVRPVAAVALSIGMVMSVVGALPILSAGAAAPADTIFATNQPVAAAGQPTPERTEATRTGPAVAPSPPQAGVHPPIGGAVESTAGDTLDNAYLSASPTPGQAEQQPVQQPAHSAAPQPQPQPGSDLTKNLPATSSGPNTILLLGIAVTILALILLALLYTARRRYYDPLLR